MKDISEHKYLFHQGRDHRAYEFMGAHPEDGGVVFRVWAPNAVHVSLVGSFNYWDPSTDPMERLSDDPSIWEVFLDRARPGDLYKFQITDDKGNSYQKADPYAFFSENGNNEEGSQRASIVYGLDSEIGAGAANGAGDEASQDEASKNEASKDVQEGQNVRAPYAWADSQWIEARRSKDVYRSPMNIYEVHLGSWMRKPDGRVNSYRETADMLIPYVKDMGYTHIELLPLTEYPFDGSWGYQVTGYFSPTSRYGNPEDLKYLIDTAHQNGIGVIMDWVPAHFTKDEYGLIEFDGHPLYEDSNPYRMEHKGWGTRAFDFGRPEVLSFLISSAFYFCDVFHMDGLRVDAVAAMLYLDYGREDGEWSPNSEGGRDNKEAINFLQNMNRDVLSAFPGVVTIAEESTAWAGITLPPETGGLGFNFKWDMGWMNDELEYFSTDPFFRSDHHHELVFSLDYVWGENYILPISHDEVVHGKRSMIDKMAGHYEDKFKTLRTFFLYMYAHPGKKLSFMGNEFGQFREWSEARELDWPLLEYETHRGLKDFVRDLGNLYTSKPQLFALDNSDKSFRWISGGDVNNSVISFIRYSGESQDDPLIIVINLSGSDLYDYRIGVPGGEEYEVVLDTDARIYGGTGKRENDTFYVSKESWDGFDTSLQLTLPALSGIYLERKV